MRLRRTGRELPNHGIHHTAALRLQVMPMASGRSFAQSRRAVENGTHSSTGRNVRGGGIGFAAGSGRRRGSLSWRSRASRAWPVVWVAPARVMRPPNQIAPMGQSPMTSMPTKFRV